MFYPSQVLTEVRKNTTKGDYLKIFGSPKYCTQIYKYIQNLLCITYTLSFMLPVIIIPPGDLPTYPCFLSHW